MKRRDFVTGVAMAAALPRAYAQGVAAEWTPTRPIKWVHPAAPGGASDVFARMIIERLSKRLGQPVVMDYKPGGGSAIAAEFVSRQPPDGHTLFFSTTTFNLHPLLTMTSYDPIKDFTHLLVIADINMLLGANAAASSAFRSPHEMVAWSKANPGKAFVALPNRGGTGELIVELINLTTGAKLQPVIYKGGAPMMTDVLGGQVPMAVESLATFGEYVKAGKMFIVVAGGNSRVPGYPQTPTLAETIVPGADINAWFALQMPAGAPAPIVNRLNRELNEIIKEKEIVEAFAKGGATMVGGSSQAATQLITSRSASFARIIKQANIKTE